MRIISEITGKEYKTVDDCLKAEEAVAVEKAAEAAKKDKLTKERKQRAAEVNEAYKEVEKAYKNYTKLVNNFVEDYGSYHMTIKDDDPLFGDMDVFDMIKYAFSW